MVQSNDVLPQLHIQYLKELYQFPRLRKTALDEFCNISQRHHFSFEETNSQATVYATFKDKPFVQAQRIVGSDVSYDVIIVLKDTTGIIENALAHGVEMEL